MTDPPPTAIIQSTSSFVAYSTPSFARGIVGSKVTLSKIVILKFRVSSLSTTFWTIPSSISALSVTIRTLFP